MGILAECDAMSRIKTHNCKVLPKSKLVFCSKCNSIVFVTDIKMYSYLKIIFNCRCGSDGGMFEISENVKRPPEYIEGVSCLHVKNNIYSCPSEEYAAFEAKPEHLAFFAYRAICNCDCKTQYEGGVCIANPFEESLT